MILSVVVPTKDRPASLDRLLRSVRRQTLPNIEILVVDDGSSVPARPAGDDVRYIEHKVNRGACAARNTGYQGSRGRYIAFFDDDAELSDPTTLASAINWFQRLPRCGAIGFRQTDALGQTRGVNPGSSTYACATNRFYSYGCVLSRDALDLLGGFQEILGYYHEEVEFSLRLIDRGFVLVYDPALSVIHHEDTIGRNWKRISRVATRNALLTVVLDYPGVLVPIGLGRALWNSVRAFHGRIGIDPFGKVRAVLDATRLLPSALARRSPVRTSTILRYRSLGRASRPVEIG